MKAFLLVLLFLQFSFYQENAIKINDNTNNHSFIFVMELKDYICVAYDESRVGIGYDILFKSLTKTVVLKLIQKF
jgi:hypothetical protein